MKITEQEPEKQNWTEEKRPQPGKNAWDIRPYLAVGLTVVLVVLVCLAIFFFIFRFQGFADGIAQVIDSIQAVIIGFILAYLLNPVMRFFERIYTKKLFVKNGRLKNRRRLIRSLAVATAMAIFLTLIFVLVMLLVPQLVVSIQELVLTMGDKMDALISWVQRLVNNSELEGQIESLAEEGFAALETWLREQILDNGTDLMTQLTTGVVSVVKTIFNIIVGMIVAVYVLMTKERFVGQAKKVIYAIFRPKAGNVIMEVLRKADEVFIGYFIGYIIDSMIVGCICFVVMSIIGLPYAPLISVIVGVTNIIPYFGPYIGAIPQRDTDLPGESDPGDLFPDYDLSDSAGGRQCDCAEDRGGFHRTLPVLGGFCDPFYGRMLRHSGNGIRRAGICDDLLSGEAHCGSFPAEEKAAG